MPRWLRGNKKKCEVRRYAGFCARRLPAAWPPSIWAAGRPCGSVPPTRWLGGPPRCQPTWCCCAQRLPVSPEL